MKNLPRNVTLIYKADPGSVSVVHLMSVGRKNYRGQVILREFNGEERDGATWTFERERYLLVEGKRFDIQDRLRKMKAEYERARQEHEQTRERAKWELLHQWDEQHPSPRMNDIRAFLTELGVKIQ